MDLTGDVRFVGPTDPGEIATAIEDISAEIGVRRPETRTSGLPARHTLERSAARYAEILFPSFET
jgi:hypothetical protein